MAAIGRFQKGDETFFAKVVDGEVFRLNGDPYGSPSFDKKPTKLKGLRTLTPVTPSKVVAVGLNYADHAQESNKPLPKEPLFWIKATTSLLPDGGKIEIPFSNHRTDFEAELAIVIGRRVRNVTPPRPPVIFLATRLLKTSAIGRFRTARASGRGPSRSTRSLRWGHLWRPRSTRTN